MPLPFYWTFIKHLVRNRAIRHHINHIRNSEVMDVNYYLSQLPPDQREEAKLRPEAHYLIVGEKLNLKPNPLFVTSYYRGQMERNHIQGSPFLHYLGSGATSAIFLPNPQFNGAQYLRDNPDVALHNFHPLMHYYWKGFKENRVVPGKTFNQISYLNRFPSLKDFHENPLAHYINRETEFPTELWGLQPGEAISEVKPQETVPQNFGLSVELLIPVYRRPDCVESLMESLIKSEDWHLIAKVTLMDDRGDTYTSKYLQDLKNRSPKIDVIVNPKNLGFLASCNNAYKTTKSDVVVLVNTDIRVPNRWLIRLLHAMNSDPKVALVTPLATNGANLSVSLRPGQSWCDADAVIARTSAPIYPDACTGVGYVMGIRRKAITTETLFDPIYEHGYCEDTDLHYRLVQSHWRSVICDNLLVFHQGSASYELDAKKTQIYENNRKIFFDRWANVHNEHWQKYVQTNALARVLTPSTHTKFEEKKRKLDVLFISPTNNTSYGGVRIIFEIAAYLCEHGVKAAVLCHEHTGPIQPQARDLLMPYLTEEYLKENVEEVKLLVGTGLGVDKVIDRMAAAYKSSDLVWFLQGPEGYFDFGERYFKFKEYLHRSKFVISVSEYLSGLAKFLGVKDATAIPLGPNPYEFYPRDVARDPKAVAIHLIDTPDKGSRFCMPFAERLVELGANVHFFGDGALAKSIPSSLGMSHGRINADGLAKLFSQCTYYLDLSMMEGLGLLPLEAAYCGCRPIMTKKGAPDLIFSESNVTWLPTHLDFESGVKAILSAQPLEENAVRDLRSKYSTELAAKRFLEIVRKHL